LSQNCRKPSASADLSQNAATLVRVVVHLLKILALHLQLHLRALLEDLGVTLP
jgi:hypothetical protein